MKIGIFELGQQEDIKKALLKINSGLEFVTVNKASQLNNVEAVVFPRGSSLGYSEEMVTNEWTKALKNYDGKILTICGSLIVFAFELGEECEGRKANQLLSIRVDNNKINGEFNGWSFTDAPEITILDPRVKAIFSFDGKVVAVRQDNIFGFSFFDSTGEVYRDFLSVA